MFTDYQLGLLYGGGAFVNDEYRFYTTNRELFDYMENVLNYLLADFSSEVTNMENFRARLYIKDIDAIENLKDNGFSSESPRERIISNCDFIRGYLETNGTFYSYLDKGTKMWRCTFSGQLEDLELIKAHLEEVGVKCRSIEVRKTKKQKTGTVSITYRLPIGARKGLIDLVAYLNTQEEGSISLLLRDKFDEFLNFDRKNPKRTNTQEFKRAKYAVESMCRVLGFELKKAEMKRPYLIHIGTENDEWEFEGYKEAHDFLSKIYTEIKGIAAPEYKS